MTSIRLQTERLILRRWQTKDIEPYAELCSDPEVMRWIGSGVLRSHDECVAAISSFENFWEHNGFGLFALELKSTQHLIGFTGLTFPNYLPEVMPAVEIGWRLARSSWGKGYATEAARAALNFAIIDKGLASVVSIHQLGNEASGRIMQKLGMTFLKQTIDPSCQRPVKVYELNAVHSGA